MYIILYYLCDIVNQHQDTSSRDSTRANWRPQPRLTASRAHNQNHILQQHHQAMMTCLSFQGSEEPATPSFGSHPLGRALQGTFSFPIFNSRCTISKMPAVRIRGKCKLLSLQWSQSVEVIRNIPEHVRRTLGSMTSCCMLLWNVGSPRLLYSIHLSSLCHQGTAKIVVEPFQCEGCLAPSSTIER